MNTGFKKMLRDLILYKRRTILTLIGVLIGITSVGVVLSAYSILNREMNRNFMDTNPASMVIYASNLDDNAARLLSRSFNNLDIEFRKTVQARISRGDGTYGTIYLRAIPDFENRKVDTFSLEKGRFPENSSRFIIPIKNLFRKRVRTLIAVLALLTGGVLYMTSQNIVTSIGKTVDMSMKEFRWDYSVLLSGNYTYDKLDETLDRIHGLNGYEVWKGCTALLAGNNSTDSVNCQLRIIPEKSNMVISTILDSLDAKKRNTIVVNSGLVKDKGWIKAGMTVKVVINGKSAELVVTKIISEVPALPMAYMGTETFEGLFGGKTGQLILAPANTRNFSEQRSITKAIESDFKVGGIEIAENLNIYVLRKTFVDHLFVIVTFLTSMSMLAVVVGGLGIGTAIEMNISERKREIGVFRAVGANRHQLIVMVLAEVFMMGIISWMAGIVLSYPVSRWVGNYFGQIFLGMDLQNTLSLSGSIQWLIISTIVSIVAGFLPAWKASSSPLREMLAYE